VYSYMNLFIRMTIVFKNEVYPPAKQKGTFSCKEISILDSATTVCCQILLAFQANNYCTDVMSLYST
jgi:hypothetical protein